MSRIYIPHYEQFEEMSENLRQIEEAIGAQVDVSTFAAIQKAVRMGIAPKALPVGTLLTVEHGTYGSKPWVVLGHDVHANADNPNGHTMTIGAVPTLITAQFDAPEAFYYAETGLTAGTYNFTLATAYGQWVAGTYQFTLANALPVGGQLTISGRADAAMTSCKVYAFASRTTTTRTEEAVITVGSGGTALGTFGTELNHSHRVSYGSNNYKESAIRQLLNSTAAAGAVWTPQTRFDRPPSWVSDMAGFLNAMDSDLLGVVCNAVVKCSTTDTYEAPDSTTPKNTAYEAHDKFFLLSNKELNFNADVADGSVTLPYYIGATNADRIKYNSSGVAAIWWERTPNSGSANNVRRLSADGSLHFSTAGGAVGLAPACAIG